MQICINEFLQLLQEPSDKKNIYFFMIIHEIKLLGLKIQGVYIDKIRSNLLMF